MHSCDLEILPGRFLSVYLNSRTMGLIWFLIVGAVSGWLAGLVWKGSGFGIIGNIVVGIVGALVGGWLAGKLGIRDGGLLLKILISAGGAWLILYVFSLFSRK